MRFEASLDVIQPFGRRFITNEGHLVTLSSELEKECQKSGLSPTMLSEIIVDFFQSKSKISSSYVVPLKGNTSSCIITNVIDLWMTNALTSTHVIMTLSINGDSGEVRFVYPQFFAELAKSILSNNMKYECNKIVMNFPYMFVIFDTFNAFKKVYSNVVEGIVNMEGSSYMFSKTEMRSLIWKVDTTKVDYISNELIPEKMRSLIKGDYY
ncbi:hypothetical protein [Sulfuracidifex tepidarius]|uniref:Uncharacterized protein n=1 Tax=Sulfuracidifex tepidarius TaxID=1294262 RepID=A0A510E3P1_9CREN|nr:hypothetical protein [Sulfuracidifex tepidarius]BBG24329.1 hypothetical protein IC006_1639 [Sulfuracidifex tepidarius]BBG27086.1 hypothetical protein IC007_1616 [Sulfuracidifex tepidarius]